MQEEQSLPDAAERCAAKLVGSGGALDDVVSAAGAHAIDEEGHCGLR
jgi:hypothetical protein